VRYLLLTADFQFDGTISSDEVPGPFNYDIFTQARPQPQSIRNNRKIKNRSQKVGA
jgi:hypothetical protein